MAYQYALSNIYNHYLTTYAPKSATRYDAHKKSELRNVYNSIVKLNKDAPLSIVDTSEAAQKYVVGIKENARELRNTITSLSGSDETELLNRKIATQTLLYSTYGLYLTSIFLLLRVMDLTTAIICRSSIPVSLTHWLSPQSM